MSSVCKPIVHETAAEDKLQTKPVLKQSSRYTCTTKLNITNIENSCMTVYVITSPIQIPLYLKETDGNYQLSKSKLTTTYTYCTLIHCSYLFQHNGWNSGLYWRHCACFRRAFFVKLPKTSLRKSKKISKTDEQPVSCFKITIVF